MREMIVTCDRCGEVVEPHTGGVRLEVARDGESRDLLPRTYDLCRSAPSVAGHPAVHVWRSLHEAHVPMA